jgi:hypothetical protein
VVRFGTLGLSSVSSTDLERDAMLSDAGAAPAVLRIEAREDVVVAEATAELAIAFAGL